MCKRPPESGSIFEECGALHRDPSLFSQEDTSSMISKSNLKFGRMSGRSCASMSAESLDVLKMFWTVDDEKKPLLRNG